MRAKFLRTSWVVVGGGEGMVAEMNCWVEREEDIVMAVRVYGLVDWRLLLRELECNC